MKISDFLKNILEIKNKEGYKVVTFLGKEFKLNSTSVMLKYLKKENDILKQQMQAAKYIMDCSFEITKCKKATGYIRMVQEARLNVLKFVVKLFEDNNIEYWLDGGTALGAYRHKGFIPWDDDIDIVVPRHDYDRALKNLNETFKGTRFFASIGGTYKDIKYTQILKIHDDIDCFTYLDIFPYDFCNNPNLTEEELLVKLKDLQKQVYTKAFKEKLYDGKHKIEDYMPMIFELYKKEGITIENGKNCYMFHGIDSMSKFTKQTIQKVDDIYPLKRGQFEDLIANVPNNLPGFLGAINEGGYGDIMALPPLDVMKVHKNATLNDYDKISSKLQLTKELLKKYE